eukprot:CAMPEP_0196657258 /NCGR_PEP_ID=MMETSP1086-20130531/22539_1 /TAXON_ID=77921 /ORGANISM="Cyanoptyche  gloeocystis , Strain SAG4.97" /LENGTH=98 /DNA_ID=CAMNT_0041990317 /DNA_START=790 /DNA_END=1086 /DNA_ORIENTATION=-
MGEQRRALHLTVRFARAIGAAEVISGENVVQLGIFLGQPFFRLAFDATRDCGGERYGYGRETLGVREGRRRITLDRSQPTPWTGEDGKKDFVSSREQE